MMRRAQTVAYCFVVPLLRYGGEKDCRVAVEVEVTWGGSGAPACADRAEDSSRER